MKIPKKLKVLDYNINVIIDEDLIDKRDRYGEADFRKLTIRLVDKEKHKIPDDIYDRVFLHELLHICFDAINENELRENEKLIDNLAGLLSQAFKTMEY